MTLALLFVGAVLLGAGRQPALFDITCAQEGDADWEARHFYP
jgi:hypothetical protein